MYAETTLTMCYMDKLRIKQVIEDCLTTNNDDIGGDNGNDNDGGDDEVDGGDDIDNGTDDGGDRDDDNNGDGNDDDNGYTDDCKNNII
ncbi:hypothetical protein ACF0H5_008831 [Mactra antiquata]